MNSRKKNGVVRFFLSMLWIVAIAVFSLLGWLSFSVLDRVSSLSVIPRKYSLYIHTDAAWKSVEPLIDLQAADVLLSVAEYAPFRTAFMELRSSPLRSRRWFTWAASRRVDVALYGATTDKIRDFTAVVDMGVLSGVTRLAGFFLPRMNIPGLSYIQEEGSSHFEYRSDGHIFYFKPYHNLIVLSGSPELFRTAVRGNNGSSYTAAERKLLTEKNDQPFRVVADAREFALAFSGQNPVLTGISQLLEPGTLSVVSFGISDSAVNMTAKFPLDFSANDSSPFNTLLSRDSQLPALLTRMSDVVQYYTLINAGSLAELKTALFQFLPDKEKNDAAWNKAESLCHTFFSLSLEDIIFSWTGKEFAALGIEGQNDPVFVLQIADETQRKNIFEKVLSSIIIKDDTSLILGGVRLPRLVLPDFIQGILSVFGVKLPSPYYIVQDGYMYFSESPESLSALYTSVNHGRRIAANKDWQAVSSLQSASSTVSLYYNLERSVPFFLRTAGSFTKVLELYNRGRCDIRIKNSVLICQLQAAARRSGDMRSVPGFPVSLAGTPDSDLQTEPGKNPGAVFWTENGTTVKSLELSGMSSMEQKMTDTCMIVSAAENLPGGGVLWGVTSQGAVYLFNRQLENIDGFPVVTGEIPSARPSAVGKTLLVPLNGGKVCIISDNGEKKILELPVTGSFKSAPGVLGSIAALYDKGFSGEIFFIEDGVCTNGTSPLEVSGIAFGSPAMAQIQKKLYTGFITQAGLLYLWADGEPAHGFPKKIDGVFYHNVVVAGEYFFALSAEGKLFRIDRDGTVTSIALPWGTAQNGSLTAADPEGSGKDKLYVGTDGNVLYGFSQNLEMLSDFPLAGWGTPVFADVNGDRNKDCIVLTVDKKLTAWNLR